MEYKSFVVHIVREFLTIKALSIQGIQDFPAIVSAAKGDTEWMIVELDNCATDMMTAVQESYTYLVENGLGIGKG